MENEVEVKEVAEVEVESNDTLVTEDVDGTKKDDGEDTPEDVEEAKNEPEKSKKQNADERKRHAEMRRTQEAKEREQAISKAKKEGIIEGLDGTNPYTGTKIEDDIDFELYKEMKGADDKGYDPKNANDMYKYRKEVRLEEKKALEAVNLQQQQKESFIKNDFEGFSKTNPNVDTKKLLEDKEFLEFSDGMLGVVPLSTIYEKYSNYTTATAKKAEEILLEKQSRTISNPGSMTSEEENPNDVYTMEELAKMSREDIERNYEKVERSYFKKDN